MGNVKTLRVGYNEDLEPHDEVSSWTAAILKNYEPLVGFPGDNGRHPFFREVPPRYRFLPFGSNAWHLDLFGHLRYRGAIFFGIPSAPKSKELLSPYSIQWGV